MDDVNLVERLCVTREWFDEPDHWPEWVQDIAFGGYREQGWNACLDGKMVASGQWGDEIIRLRDGTIACTLYPAGYCSRAAIAVGTLTTRIAALEAGLSKANAQTEHFEREWYLRGDRVEALEAENARLREAGAALLAACHHADAREELAEEIDGSLLDALDLAIWPEIWSQETVDALNAHQDRNDVHPYTCGAGNRIDAAHVAAQEEHGGDFGQLVATRQGWVCLACDYRQFHHGGTDFPPARALLTDGGDDAVK